MSAALDQLHHRLQRPPSLGQERGDRELLWQALRWRRTAPVCETLREAASAPATRAALIECLFELLCSAEPDLSGSGQLDAACEMLLPEALNARELLDRLPAVLGDQRANEAARVGAAALMLAYQGREPAMVTFAVSYLDALLSTGKCRNSFLRAVDAWRDATPLPASPSTRGRKRVKGSDDLDLEPYCQRRIIADAFDALGRTVLVDRRVLPWLFEGAKLWSDERELALAAIRNANPTEAELRAGFDELVHFCALKPSPERAGLVRSALEVGGSDPRWLALLLASLEPQSALCEALGELLSGVPRLASASAADDARWLTELQRLADAAVQPVIRTIAFAAAGGSEATAAAILESLPAELAHVVSARIVESRAFGPEIARALESPLQRLSQSGDEPEAVADLAAVAWNCRQAARASSAELLPGARLFEPRPIGGALVCLYHRIRTLVPPSTWSNDEDELGAIVISARDDRPVHVRLPMQLPIRPNGAQFSKRRLEVEHVFDGELFVSILCPFSDARGWGTESYLWSFRPPSAWRSWQRVSGGLVPADAGAEPEAIGYGELLLWRDGAALGFELDDTPYHLDDWVRSEQVTQAIAAAERARAARDHLPPSDAALTWSAFDAALPEERPELETVWAGCWGGRRIALAQCRVEGLAELSLVNVR
jgi:hypothetical protein